MLVVLGIMFGLLNSVNNYVIIIDKSLFICIEIFFMYCNIVII